MDALAEIEAIRLLKARYCRLLDLKDWHAWRGLFTDDFVSDTSESGGPVIQGADEFVAFVRDTLGAPQRTTVHMVHAPEIELVSATQARGIWMLEDLIRFAPGLGFRGHGHYHESYEKQGDAWRIQSSKLTRLREDIVTPFFSLQVSGWLRRQSIKAGQRHSAAWVAKRRAAAGPGRQ